MYCLSYQCFRSLTYEMIANVQTGRSLIYTYVFATAGQGQMYIYVYIYTTRTNIDTIFHVQSKYSPQTSFLSSYRGQIEQKIKKNYSANQGC
jgi:hypothetical protein